MNKTYVLSNRRNFNPVKPKTLSKALFPITYLLAKYRNLLLLYASILIQYIY